MENNTLENYLATLIPDYDVKTGPIIKRVFGDRPYADFVSRMFNKVTKDEQTYEFVSEPVEERGWRYERKAYIHRTAEGFTVVDYTEARYGDTLKTRAAYVFEIRPDGEIANGSVIRNTDKGLMREFIVEGGVPIRITQDYAAEYPSVEANAINQTFYDMVVDLVSGKRQSLID